jgi:HSP20 family molecular chaperone IbpA
MSNLTGTKTAPVPQAKVSRPEVAPLVRVRETAEGYEFAAELPAVAESALHVTVEERTLAIEAETEWTPKEGYRLVREEFPAVRYRGVFEIPERVDAGGIRATLRNGVLRLSLPKREEVKPRRIAVTSEENSHGHP